MHRICYWDFYPCTLCYICYCADGLCLVVEEELRLLLLWLVDRHTGEERLRQLSVSPPLDHEANLHEHLPAAGGYVVDAALGQGVELVHMYVHLHVAGGAEDGACAPDEYGFGVVCRDGGGDAKLLQVGARVDHLWLYGEWRMIYGWENGEGVNIHVHSE
jgi:hypothetical protein